MSRTHTAIDWLMLAIEEHQKLVLLIGFIVSAEIIYLYQL